MNAARDTLLDDQMASLAAVKNMKLAQKQACVLYLPCSLCTGSHAQATCHRVCDFVHDRGRGERFYRTCAAAGVNSARNNARNTALKRECSLRASLLFPSLKGIERYTDAQLHYIVALFMQRPDVVPLWARGSRSLTYWFFWTCESAAGWRAPEAELLLAEQTESTNWLRSSPNPLLWAHDGDGVRKVVQSDIFFADTPVRILRVAIGVVKEDEAEMECEGCRLTKRTLGFAGNRKIGGTGTRRKGGNIHGLSVFVVSDFTALGFVLDEQYCAAYAATDLLYGGSEAVDLPAAPPASFEPPPLEASGARVLGGPLFLAARGLGGAAAAAAAADFVVTQESADAEEEYIEWDCELDGRNVYFTGKSPSDKQVAGIVALGGTCHLGLLTKSNPMSLLVAKYTSAWRKTAKGLFALKNKVPVAFFEQLDEVLAGEEEEEEEEDEEDEEDSVQGKRNTRAVSASGGKRVRVGSTTSE
jgi:hypothetical protein